MPIAFTEEKTPGGKTILRSVSSGVITAADAGSTFQRLGPGEPFEGAGLLSLIAPGAEFSAEARKAFTYDGSGSRLSSPVAVVVESAPMRVMLSFVVRMAGMGGHTKFFSSEAQARAWLVERLDGTP